MKFIRIFGMEKHFFIISRSSKRKIFVTIEKAIYQNNILQKYFFLFYIEFPLETSAKHSKVPTAFMLFFLSGFNCYVSLYVVNFKWITFYLNNRYRFRWTSTYVNCDNNIFFNDNNNFKIAISFLKISFVSLASLIIQHDGIIKILKINTNYKICHNIQKIYLFNISSEIYCKNICYN